MPKQYFSSGFFIILLMLCSCSSGTKKDGIQNDTSKVVTGKSRSSEPVTFSNAMSHWIGRYTFTDSYQNSFVESNTKKDYNASSNLFRPSQNPKMDLVISVENAKLQGNLTLSNVEYPRAVEVFIRGNAKEIGIYFLSEKSPDKAEEEKGELLFILKHKDGILSTVWKAWYPRSNNLVNTGFVKSSF